LSGRQIFQHSNIQLKTRAIDHTSLAQRRTLTLIKAIRNVTSFPPIIRSLRLCLT